MESSSMEVISEGEWSSLSGMYTTTEEANFMAQLLGPNNVPSSLNAEINLNSGSASRLDWHATSDHETSFYAPSSSDNFFSQIPNGPVHHHHHHHHESDHYLNLMSNHNLSAISNGGVFLEDKYLNHNDEMMPEHMMSNNVHLKEEDEPTKENINNSFESSRKRSRSTGNIQKLKRNVKLKKTQSFELSRQTTVEDGSNCRAHKSITCCSDQDESSLSQEPNGSAKEPATLNLSGRTRASRGAATDPQSLYARKRRERINERLKVLQGLIPNGTKVDISTMLEEAVHYVKFLQLQIKLLSSDDLWMFAPIAYNGIDLGLDMRIHALMR